jgi:hypothetical protein
MNTGSSYFEKVIKSTSTFLSRWSGTDAELWELTASHKCLRILLSRKNSSGNLLIACIDPLMIKGPIRWNRAALRVSVIEARAGNETSFVVTDPSVNLEVICGGLEVAENVKLR